MDTVRGTVSDQAEKAVWILWDHFHSRGFVPVQLMSLFPADRQTGRVPCHSLPVQHQDQGPGSRHMGFSRELHDLRGGGAGAKVGHWRRRWRAKKVRACVRRAVLSQGKICVCCPMVGLDFGLTFGTGGPMSFLIKRIWIPKNPPPCPKRDAGCWDTQSVNIHFAG